MLKAENEFDDGDGEGEGEGVATKSFETGDTEGLEDISELMEEMEFLLDLGENSA